MKGGTTDTLMQRARLPSPAKGKRKPQARTVKLDAREWAKVFASRGGRNGSFD